MTTALSWKASGQLTVMAIAPGRRMVIGRSSDVDVVIDDPKVSRQHAAIITSAAGGEHRLEHLSKTNPTLLDGAPLQGQGTLKDGAQIGLADTQLTFHDLHARDMVSGPVCHVCGRENADADRDCWYCGTSLLNAPTTLRERRPVVLRVVSANGTWADLYSGRWIALRPNGSLETLRAAPPADVMELHIEDGLPVLVDARNEGSGGGAGQDLDTGSVIALDGAQFAIIASEESAAK